MGLMLAEPGFHTRAFVEWEEYPRSSIIAAQRAGYFAPAPIWDDLTTFDARPFAGAFDTLLAGYPCQPFSQAGQRRGADDERHLWPDVSRVIRELGGGLEWVFLENVAGHVTLGLETVLRELWDMGFTPAAGLFTAAETGAPHERERVFIVAHRDSDFDTGGMVSRRYGCAAGGSEERHTIHREASHGELVWVEPWCGRDELADACGPEREGQQRGQHHPRGWQVKDGYSALQGGAGLYPPGLADMDGWRHALAVAPYLAPAAGLADCLAWAIDMAAAVEGQGKAQAQSALRRMADGLALRSRALRLLGNGVHPLAAAYAWRSLAAAHGLWALDLDAAGERHGAASTLAI